MGLRREPGSQAGICRWDIQRIPLGFQSGHLAVRSILCHHRNKNGRRRLPTNQPTRNVRTFDDYIATRQSRLPKLLDVEQLSPRVLRVLSENLGKVRSTLVHRQFRS